MSEISNPWDVNYFDPPTPHVPPPSPRSRPPRLLPEQDDLFTVQRHALDVLHDIRDLEAKLGEHAKGLSKELTKLERDAENTYRVIRSYLAQYGQ